MASAAAPPAPQEMRGADIVIESLVREGVGAHDRLVRLHDHAREA